jgi:hypothetical protein
MVCIHLGSFKIRSPSFSQVRTYFLRSTASLPKFSKTLTFTSVIWLSPAQLIATVFATKAAFRLTSSSTRVGAAAVSHLQLLKTALLLPPRPNSKLNSASLISAREEKVVEFIETRIKALEATSQSVARKKA